MKEQLISFETAKLAKEKGFVPEIISEWGNDEEILYEKEITQSLLQKWLRDIHNIHINLVQTIPKGWIYSFNLITIDNLNPVIQNGKFNSYEEALEEGLKKALNLIN